MTTTNNSPCRKRHKRTAQKRHHEFIDLHRQILLSYLDGKLPANADDMGAFRYVEKVLKDWHEQFRNADIAGPDLQERTFWYALYQLEVLVETGCSHIDPYEAFLMQNLVEVRELLRDRQPLPEDRFMATRPDGR